MNNNDRLPIRYALLVWVGVTAICWWVIASTACSLFAPSRPTPPITAREVTAEQALSPSLWPAVRALVVDEIPNAGLVRQLYPSTACEASIPLPYIIPANRPPRVGEEWQCLFVTTVSPQPPEPNWFAWIITSTRAPDSALPIALDSIGLPGCKLLVNLDAIISVPPGSESALLTRAPDRGRILLRWTPQPGMAGQKLWMQLMVHAPGRSPGGFLLSYAIEITVGS